MPLNLDKSRRLNTSALIVILLCLYTLFPFVYISKYDHPQSDDYFTVMQYRKNSFLGIQVTNFEKWSGRYTSFALSYLNPLGKNNLAAYRLFSAFLILLISFSISLLVWQVFRPYFNILNIAALSGFFITLYFMAMPSISQGIYWFSAYKVFQVSNILTLWFLSVICRIHSGPVSGYNYFLKIVSVLLLVLIIGGNSISIIIINSVIISLNLYSLLHLKKANRYYIVLFIVSLIFTLIFISAPGNYHRVQGFQYSENPVLSLTAAFGLTTVSFFKWGLPVIVFSLVYVLLWGNSLVKKIEEENFFRRIRFVHSFPAFVIVLFLMYFVYAWLTGSKPVGRADNVFYLYFIAGWFFNLNVLLLQIYKHKDPEFLQANSIIGVLIITAFVMVIFSVDNNISTAYIDIISGKAKKYDRELTARYELIKTCEKDTCIVPALKNIPKTLFFRDIASGKKSVNKYIIKSYSEFFDKKYIVRTPGRSAIKPNMQTLEDFMKEKRKEISGD